jgi:hypothetical protein
MYRDMLGTVDGVSRNWEQSKWYKVSYEEQRTGIYNATLDPTNPKTYEILNSILMKYPLFPGSYFILVVMRTMARNGMQTQLFSNLWKKIV